MSAEWINPTVLAIIMTRDPTVTIVAPPILTSMTNGQRDSAPPLHGSRGLE